MTMTIKNDDEIRRMDEAGQVVAIIHARIESAIAPGVTTADLDACTTPDEESWRDEVADLLLY